MRNNRSKTGLGNNFCNIELFVWIMLSRNLCLRPKSAVKILSFKYLFIYFFFFFLIFFLNILEGSGLVSSACS